MKLEAVYKAIGYAKDIDMGEEEEYNRGGPEVSTVNGAPPRPFPESERDRSPENIFVRGG